MAVDTQKKHYECSKCGAVYSVMDSNRGGKEDCPKGGKHNLKVVQASWDKSALGATVNVGAGFVKWGAKKAAEKAAEKAERKRIENELSPEEKAQREEQERILKAERDAKSKEEWNNFINLIKKFKWVIVVIVVLLAGRVIYLRFNKPKVNTEPIVIEQTENNPSTTITPETKETEKTETNEKVESNSDDLTGTWKGKFGKDKLIISITNIDANGAVTGYDEVKGNKRDLRGTYNAETNEFMLNEPGDDEWDGVFTFKYNSALQAMEGKWESNNGKSKKDFSLKK